MRGDDVIQSANYNDELRGNNSDDTLIGGHGNDCLKGGSSNDTFIFTKGDNAHTIRDYSGKDTLDLSEFSLADLVVNLEGRDLFIEFDDQQTNNADSVTIENWQPWYGGSLSCRNYSAILP